MESNRQKSSESLRKKKTRESKLNPLEILNLIAEVSHKTWMKQAAQAPKWEGKELPKEPFPDDHKRAEDAWKQLESFKPKTRERAVAVVAISSHLMWLAYKESERLKVGGPIEKLDPIPNDHDKERAEDIINALEARGVLSFPK